MKKITLAALVATCGFMGSGLAQNANNSGEKEVPAFVREFQNLSEKKKKEFGKHFFEAQKLFNQKRVFECLDALADAKAIFAKHPGVLNLYGACYVEFRDFKKAAASFQQADKVSPNNQNVKFNLAEIAFVTKKYQESLDIFKEILAKNEQQDSSMVALMEFKMLLCQIKLGQVDKARAKVKKLSFKEDSPLYYYANAALDYYDDKATEAEEWLARARRVFGNGAALAPWQDTLIEFGYVKSFYGGDLEGS